MQALEIATQELDLKRLHHALTADKQTIYSLLEQPSPDLLRVLRAGGLALGYPLYYFLSGDTSGDDLAYDPGGFRFGLYQPVWGQAAPALELQGCFFNRPGSLSDE